MNDMQFKPGDRVIYTRFERRMGAPALTVWQATYVRAQVIGSEPRRQMHVIELDDRPGRPVQVGWNSIKAA